MPQKLIVVDIDGTLIDSPKQKIPSREVIQLIRDLNDNIIVTCATGRSLSWALPVLEAANFTAPPILGGGTYILNSDDLSIRHKFELPQSQLQLIKEILTSHTNLKVLYNDYTEDDYLKGGWDMELFLGLAECWMMEIVMIEEELADELISQFQRIKGVTSIKMNSFKAGKVDVHIVHEHATKEHAIQVLQEELGISKENTIGVGDGYNDFHIFDAVGTKIAVGNAVPKLKEIADEVIDEVSQDPIAKLLQRYI